MKFAANFSYRMLCKIETFQSHDDRIRVKRYASQRCLPECFTEQLSGWTFVVLVWGAISYLGRSNLLQIEGDLNSNSYDHEFLQPEVVSFLQGIPRNFWIEINLGNFSKKKKIWKIFLGLFGEMNFRPCNNTVSTSVIIILY